MIFDLNMKDQVIYRFLGVSFSIVGLILFLFSIFNIHISECSKLIWEYNSKCGFFYDFRNHIEIFNISINYFFLISYVLIVFYYLFYPIQKVNLLLHYTIVIFVFIGDSSLLFILFSLKKLTLFPFIFNLLSFFLILITYYYDFNKRSRTFMMEFGLFFFGLKNNILVQQSFIIYSILGSSFLYFLYVYIGYNEKSITEKKNYSEYQFIQDDFKKMNTQDLKKKITFKNLGIEAYGPKKSIVQIMAFYNLEFLNKSKEIYLYLKSLLKYYHPFVSIIPIHFPEILVLGSSKKKYHYYIENYKYINEYAMIIHENGQYNNFLMHLIENMDIQKKALNNNISYFFKQFISKKNIVFQNPLKFDILKRYASYFEYKIEKIKKNLEMEVKKNRFFQKESYFLVNGYLVFDPYELKTSVEKELLNYWKNVYIHKMERINK